MTSLTLVWSVGTLGGRTGRAACIGPENPRISDDPYRTVRAVVPRGLVQVMGGLFGHRVSLLLPVSVLAARLGSVH